MYEKSPGPGYRHCNKPLLMVRQPNIRWSNDMVHSQPPFAGVLCRIRMWAWAGRPYDYGFWRPIPLVRLIPRRASYDLGQSLLLVRGNCFMRSSRRFLTDEHLFCVIKHCLFSRMRSLQWLNGAFQRAFSNRVWDNLVCNFNYDSFRLRNMAGLLDAPCVISCGIFDTLTRLSI